MSRWIVLGCGVVGLCVATLLMERSEEVYLIDDIKRSPSSWFAGGMLAPWCESVSAPVEIISLGRHASAWWQKRVSTVEHQGTLVIAPQRDHQELNHFARMTEQYQWVNPGDLEPALKGRFIRGLFFSREAHLDPRITLIEMRNKLQQYGVVYCNVKKKPNGIIIDCRGIYASSELCDLRAVRGEMLILHTNDIQFLRPIRLLHPRFPCYLVPRRAGYFMLGATMVESADSTAISARAMMELLSAAYTIHPAFAEARIIESNSSLRPAYLDNLPKIDYKNGIFYLNGMYRHGFLLAPMMAEKLMQLLFYEDFIDEYST